MQTNLQREREKEQKCKCSPKKTTMMRVRGSVVVRREEAINPDLFRAALSEFFSTLIFVFAGEGSVLALGKLSRETESASKLVGVALAHAFALFVAVSIGSNKSAGHVNPAVTFGALVGGQVSSLRAVFFWVAQLLGSIVAASLLVFTTSGMRLVGCSVASGVGVWHALILEIVMTFGLVYTVFATAFDPKRGSLETIAPLAIGFIVGANILVGGAFDGAAMNPARAFGPALVSWRWRDHWVYWVGPFVGGGLASLIYALVFIPTEPVLAHHQTSEPEDY